MKLFNKICVGLLLLPGASLWSQVDNPSTQPAPAYGTDTPVNNADVGDSRMLTPPPVSGQSYPSSFSGGERSNYLRGGLAFTSAYTDNAIGSITGKPVSDVSYSVAPFIALDETTSRLHWVLTYAPGFTFYQRLSSRNETDQNASIDLQYRLSPHVTFSARDGFQKSSNVFNQPFLAGTAVAGGTQEPNFSVIAPVADRLSNSGNVGISYQFAANGMVGANGTFSNLHYPNQAQVPGLFDSSSQGGSAFYSLRVSKMHYIGATYQYQRLVSYPTGGQDETQTHAVLFFYTLYASSKLSFSAFGGPQHSDTVQPPLPPLQLKVPEARAWTPAAGASMSWQGRLTNVALSYSHMISGGGGLIGAVKMDSANASIRQQIARRLSGSVGGGYAQNNVLGSALDNTNGHTVSGTASLQQEFGQHINVQLGYTRLHQNYSGVAVLAATPNTNREFISISYQFSRPLGR
jgi:hypothetical protein